MVKRLVLKYTDGKTNIDVAATGTGGADELKAALPEDTVAYGYLRVTTGDNESKRANFVFIAWVPDSSPIMLKAKQSVHKASVKQIYKEFAIELLASDLSEVDHDKIVASVVKAGGANYMGQSSAQ